MSKNKGLNFNLQFLLTNKKTRNIKAFYAIWIFALTFFFYGYSYHLNDSDPLGKQFSSNSLLYLVLGSLYILPLAIEFYRGNLESVPMQGKSLKDLAWVTLVISFFLFLIQAIISWFMEFKQYGVNNIEIVLYYISASISEEAFFRGVLFLVFDEFFAYLSGDRNVWTKGGTILVTASIFSLAHYGVYGNEPRLMLSTFLGGLILGIGYWISGNNLFVSTIPHLINNAIAIGQFYLGFGVLVLLFILAVVPIGNRNKKQKKRKRRR